MEVVFSWLCFHQQQVRFWLCLQPQRNTLIPAFLADWRRWSTLTFFSPLHACFGCVLAWNSSVLLCVFSKGGVSGLEVGEEVHYGNAERNNMSTTGYANWGKESLAEDLVCEYHLINMDTLIEQSATLCNEEVLASNENCFVEDDAGENEVAIPNNVDSGDSFIDVEVQNEDASSKKIEKDARQMEVGRVKKKKFLSMNSMLIQPSSKKTTSSKIQERSTKNKVEKSVLIRKRTERSIENTMKTILKGRPNKSKTTSKHAQRRDLSNYKAFKDESSIDMQLKRANDVDFEMLAEGDKEAIALRFLGENDIYCMYGELYAHLKRIQEKYKVLLVGIKGSTTKECMLDMLVSWLISENKVCIKQVMGSIGTQDVVCLSSPI